MAHGETLATQKRSELHVMKWPLSESWSYLCSSTDFSLCVYYFNSTFTLISCTKLKNLCEY